MWFNARYEEVSDKLSKLHLQALSDAVSNANRFDVFDIGNILSISLLSTLDCFRYYGCLLFKKHEVFMILNRIVLLFERW